MNLLIKTVECNGPWVIKAISTSFYVTYTAEKKGAAVHADMLEGVLNAIAEHENKPVVWPAKENQEKDADISEPPKDSHHGPTTTDPSSW